MNRIHPLALAVGLLFSSFYTSSAQNVIAWGDNTNGQTDVPAAATNAVAVAAGWNHSLALLADGSVLSWGSITNVPSTATNIVAIAAGSFHNLVLRADGTAIAWGSALATGTYGTGYGPFVGIAAGEQQNLALRPNGTVFSWGRNNLFLTYELSGVRSICSGPMHGLITFNDNSTDPLAFASWTPPGTMRRPLLSLTNIVARYGGSTNNWALLADGSIRSWGIGSQPIAPASASNVVTLALSTNCILALRADGNLVAWGSGVATNLPSAATNVFAIAAGRSHGLAVIGDGSPRFLGPPAYLDSVSVANHLPLTARVVGSSPLHLQWLADGVPIPDATNAYPKMVALLGTDDVDYSVVASNVFGCVTSSVSKVKVSAVNVWGDHASKQRSVPTTLTNPVAIAAGGFHALGLNENGSVVAWGKNASGQCTVPKAASNVVSIAAGSDHSLALRNDGTVIAWGRNWDGQTNPPASASNIVAIAAGWAHSLALQANGNVLAWGNNEMNQTNIPPYVKDITAIAAGYYHNLALKWDGSVIAWGYDEELLVPQNATNVIAIAAGWEHSMALRSDGTIVAWGNNSYGQIDIPVSATNIVALAAGYYHSLALRADGTVIGWGKGHHGVINIPSALHSVSGIAVGEDFSMALVKVGPPIFRPASTTVTVHVGGRTLLTTGIGGTQPLTFQWFFNDEPIAGATSQFFMLNPIQASDAGTYTLVVANALGETNTFVVNLVVDPAPYLITGALKQHVPPYTPVQLSATIHGLEPMTVQWRRSGTNLADGDRFLGIHERILNIHNTEFEDSGDYEVVVSNSAGSITGLVSQLNVTPVVAWGDNSSGQLDLPPGASDITAISAGGTHSLALKSDGTVIAWGNNSYDQATVPNTATNVASISAGITHNIALRNNGTIVAWGDNQYEQCIVPASATNIVAVEAATHQSLGLRSNRTVLAWSATYLPQGMTNVVAMDSGYGRVIALRGDGTAVSDSWIPSDWTNLVAVATGLQVDAALREDGTVLSRSTFQTNLHIPQMNTIAISAGNFHVLTLDSDGTVRGWGDNDNGQLNVPEYARNAVAISAGGDHSLALVQVSTNLHFATEPEDQTVGVGQIARLRALVTGRGPVSYQWYFNGSVVMAATNIDYSFTADFDKVGAYRMVASNPWSSITSFVAMVSIPMIPTITMQPQNQTVAPGGTVLFSVEAEGSAPLSYQWRFEEADLIGETASALQLSGVTPDQAGNYSVYISNSVGAATSTPAMLKVIAPSQLNFTFADGSPMLSFNGSTGISYVIQYTTNLASPTWLDIITLSNPSGSFQFIDTNLVTNGFRFYRAVGD